MLITLWFVSILFTVQTDCVKDENIIPDLTLLSRKRYNKFEYVCVAGNNVRDSALIFNAKSWSEDYIEPTSSVYRTNVDLIDRIEKEYDCDFENDKCANSWLTDNMHKVVSSENSSFQYVAPVIDERWEGFDIHLISINTPLTMSWKTSNSFSFSLRSKNGSSLLLFNLNSSNNFYYIKLSSSIIVLKCENQDIKKASPENCQEIKISNIVFNLKMWQHFTIVIDNNDIYIFIYDKFEEKYVKFQNDLRIYYKSLRIVQENIKHNKGLLKIHKYNYLSLDKSKERYELGKQITGKQNNAICVEFYALTCKNCHIKFSLNNSTKQVIKGNEQILQSWQYVKLHVESSSVMNNEFYRLKVEKIQNKNNHQDMWIAIDNVRRCRSDEYRIISITSETEKNISCQSLKYPECPILKKNSVNEYNALIMCDNKTQIGNNCNIPCQAITKERNCNEYTICKANNEKKSVCSCVFGYTGSYCGNKIPLPYLRDSLELVNSTINSLTVRLKSTMVEQPGEFQINAFGVEYKEKNAQNWISTNKTYIFSTTEIVTISNLKPEIEYSLRGILYTSNHVLNEDKNINFRNFKTICKNVESEVIKDIRITHTSQQIFIKWLPKCEGQLNINISCSYQWCPKNTEYAANTIIGNKNISDLIPNTNYTLTIQNSRHLLFNEKFVTDVGELPRLSSQPIIINITLKSVAVKFMFNQIKGKEFAHTYKIEYSDNEEFRSSATYKNKFYIINGENIQNILDLNMNSTYYIRIVLYTNKYSKDNKHIPYVKAVTDKCKDTSYFVENLKVNTGETNATITWNPVCSNQLNFEIFCVQNKKNKEWCEEPATRYMTGVKSLTKRRDLQSLSPFSTYVLIIKNENNESIQANFKTKPSAQHTAVRNLTVFERSHNKISIRWKPPLINETISYYQRFYQKCDKKENVYKAITNYVVSCDIWPNWLCHTILDISPADCYQIGIRGYYDDRGEPGHENVVEITGKEASSPPENIKFHPETLSICWNHPNFIRGQLDSFLINIVQIDSELTTKNFRALNFSDVVLAQKFEYCYKLSQPLELSSTYKIRVQTKSGLSLSDNRNLIINTEPITPELMNDITIGTRTNTTQEIKIPQITLKTNTLNSVIYVQICNEDDTDKIKANDKKFDNLTNCKGLSWIAAKFTDTNQEHNFTIGDLSKIGNEPFIENTSLNPSMSYSIHLILINEYKGYEKYKIYSRKLNYFEDDVASWNPLYLLLLLLLLIPIIAIFVYKKAQSNFVIPLFTGSTTRRNNSNSVPLNKLDGNVKENNPVHTPLLKSEKTKAIENFATTNPKYSRIIKIGNLSQYIKSSLENGELQRQHELFKKGGTKPWEYGMMKENMFKNRYKNLTAYDHSRVILNQMRGDSFSDFINANYIDGYKQKKAYIATQGPKMNTVNDFWRMIWQENVKYIVMLANITEGGKKKCEKYWPEIGVTQDYMIYSVTYLKSDIYADFEYRTFEVTDGNKKRMVQQLHFTSWPDHGVPLYPQALVPFLRKIVTIPVHEAPIVVHCSAGVGRTGTIILTDICLRMAAAESQIDALKYLHEIRENRANMVDNFNQYKLVHMVLLEYLFAPESNIPCNENMVELIENLIETGKFQKQLEYLEKTAWHNKAMATTTTLNPENCSKNRFPLIVPGSIRIFISRYPYTDENSDYINAIPVDGFHVKDQFIVTQNPLPNTLKDFWRMVNEHNCKVIVSLNEFEVNDENCSVFWPPQNEEMRPMPHLKIEHKAETLLDYYDVIKVQITNQNAEEGNEISSVKIIQFKGWKQNIHLPPNPKSLISLFEEAYSSSRDGNPIIVTCFDGTSACGIFVALSFVIEKIKLEQICDVSLATRVVRCNREQFIMNWDQYVFLYKAALEYVKSFEEYANFQGPSIINQ